MKKIVFIILSLTICSINSYSQTFVKKSIKAFENIETKAFGMAAIDYDGDGWIDISLVDLKGEERLFHNEGNGEFILISHTERGFNGGTTDCGLSWGDFDNDGDPDPFIGTQSGMNHFFRNDGTKGFSRITEGQIATDSLNSFDAVWVDYDNDGWLDLYTCNLHSFSIKGLSGAPNFFYHNNGDNTFRKMDNNGVSKEIQNTITASFADYDNDGDVDLFAPVMGSNNLFYINTGDGNFQLKPNSVFSKDSTVSLSGCWADYNNDGHLDLFVCNGVINQKDMLYKNNGDGSFSRIYDSPLVENKKSSWNGAWGDIDNDGDEDLYVSVWGDKNMFFLNKGDGSFKQIYDNPIVSESEASNTSVSAWGDFDNDGDLDFVTVNCTIGKIFFYENTGSSNNWINIKLIGTESNKSAIGTQIRITTKEKGKSKTQMREINASNGFRSIHDGFRAHFGLGGATSIDEIEIRWPSGKITHKTNVKINQHINIIE